jgi:hypothetical protein
MEKLKFKFLTALAVFFAGLLICTSGLAYHGLPAPTPPKGYTVFSLQNGDFLTTRDYVMTGLPNHQHHKYGLTKVNKAHFVFFDISHKPSTVKELIVTTQDGLRIALLNTSKLSRLIKNNPQWLHDNNITFEGTEDKYYYTTVTTLPEVWLGETDGKITLVAIPCKPE